MIETLGHFHAMVIHFPIALFILAAVIEGFRFVKFKLEHSVGLNLESSTSTTEICLIVGTVFACLAALLGWAAAGAYADTKTLLFHRWLGTGVAIWSIITVWFISINKSHRREVFALILLAGLTGLAAHFGGELVHGKLF